MKPKIYFSSNRSRYQVLQHFESFITEKPDKEDGNVYNRYMFDPNRLEFIDLLKKIKENCDILFSIGLDFDFTESDLLEISYYLLGTDKLIKETTSDRDKNIAYIGGLPSIKTHSAFSIKMADKLFISKHPNIKSKYVFAPNYDRNNNYIVTKNVRDIFVEEKIRGVEYLPLYKNDQEIHEGYYHVFTRSIMPPVEVNNLTTRIGVHGEPEFFYNQYEYDYGKISPDSDFLRSAEFPHGMFVTKAVKSCCEKHKIKGVVFAPVLDSNSDVYKVYIEEVKKLRSKISDIPNIKMGIYW